MRKKFKLPSLIITIAFLGLVGGAVISTIANASDRHHHDIKYEIVNNTSPDGAAAGLAASECSFASNYSSLQICVAGAFHEYDNGKTEKAMAVGFGKRYCLTDNTCGVGNIKWTLDEGGGKSIGVGTTLGF